MPKVVFPCDLDHWWIVKDRLHQLKEDCLQKDNFDVKDVAEAHQIVVDKVQGISITEEVYWGDTVYCGLVKYFQNHATTAENIQFVKKTFPSIIDLGLEVEALLPTDGIDINEQQKGETREISRQLCSSIVACAFLCLFPVGKNLRGRGTKLNGINFDRFFANLHKSSQIAKLQCILHFFDKVTAEKSRLTGAIVFTRQVLKREELPTLDTWLNCTSRLCDLIVLEDGFIEDAGYHTVEVDFANRFIGGGVLGAGRVQEEIRFTVCPELLVSLLFMECMEENEAIVIQGYEQFASVQGYAASLRFVGDHRDSAEMDEQGNLKNMLCAIDAVSYRQDNNSGRQYKDHNILRDLNKAFIGFCTPFTTPPGVCGRSLSMESYVTAKESENSDSASDLGDSLLFKRQIDAFVDKLLQGALARALVDASKTISGREESHDLPSSSGSEHYLHRQSSMDHLEVNFRDWYANYRRRSSNLSDLSSRRSSYDLASRRSSACSARGYSSEYSSEFEEYYDNFQQQEQRYKYHTITEEVGSSVVNEFASSLAESLLRQGAEEASGFVPQVFHGNQPNYDIKRPMPVRISTGSLSTVDSVENEEAIAREECIRQYVDKMFENMWPFNGEVPDSENELKSSEEIKQRILKENYEDTVKEEENDENLKSEEGEEVVTEKEESKEVTDVKDADDTLLLAVADRLVAIAFKEALLEYKYLMCCLENHTVHRISSLSESSQSDHSIEVKDQPDLSLAENSQSVTRKNLNSNFDTASVVAERMLAGFFNKKESDQSLILNQSGALKNQSNIPEQEVCDTNLKVVYSTSPKAHSNSSDNSELSASKRREIFSRVADNILSSGLTTKMDSEDQQSCNDLVIRSLNLSSDSSHSDSSVGRQMLSVSSSNCDYKEMSSQIMSKSSAKLGRKISSSSESKSSDSRSSDNAGKVFGSEAKKSSSLSPKKHHVSPNHSEKSVLPLNSQKSTESTDRNKTLDSRLPGHKEIKNIEGANYDGSLAVVPPYSGLISVTGTKGNKLPHMPAHQARLSLKPGRFYVTGNKKNYDQFANSLSRDLLTNAFLQVQEHNEPVAYPRRSSEPMQISNGAALQRYEHSLHIVNGRRSQKSKTDEDISQFDDEWMQQFNSRSSSGFRDPVLSRFAEELMKANVSVPPLQLPVPGDAVSISSSSQSVCSTMSSFRDPLLASFEEELLTSADKKSAKTHTSWSKARGSMCSPRPSGNSTSSSSRDGQKQFGLSMSVDSEASGMSNRSNNAFLFKTVSDYAELLSRRIMCEAMTIIYRPALTSEDSAERKTQISLMIYSDMLATSILQSALLTSEVMGADVDQNKVVTWSEETKCVHYSDKDSLDTSDLDSSRERFGSCSESGQSSVEFEDALDIPYQRLEEFADVLASKVLINSVAITRREYMCSLRRQYGRPIATGNWGCGAFGGDPHLKSLIQWMAASYAGCPSMLYYTFRNPQMSQFQSVVNTVLERGWDVSKLMQVVRRYCIIAEKEINENGFISRELFDIILQGEIFPGV